MNAHPVKLKPFHRETYFDAVRDYPFDGSMNQSQVDGQEFLLMCFEQYPHTDDLRWLAYMLATTFHETAATMKPIEEYGKGQGHEYGKPDPQTKQTYYGRGYVQLTWRDNYARATDKLELTGPNDLEWNAKQALHPPIAYSVMSRGMIEGWFTGKRLDQYFNDTTNDAEGARAIINPDSRGELVAEYYDAFLRALQDAQSVMTDGKPEAPLISIAITSEIPVRVRVTVNGEVVEPEPSEDSV